MKKPDRFFTPDVPTCDFICCLFSLVDLTKFIKFSLEKYFTSKQKFSETFSPIHEASEWIIKISRDSLTLRLLQRTLHIKIFRHCHKPLVKCICESDKQTVLSVFTLQYYSGLLLFNVSNRLY